MTHTNREAAQPERDEPLSGKINDFLWWIDRTVGQGEKVEAIRRCQEIGGLYRKAAAELAALREADKQKTHEINVLSTENRDLTDKLKDRTAERDRSWRRNREWVTAFTESHEERREAEAQLDKAVAALENAKKELLDDNSFTAYSIMCGALAEIREGKRDEV